MDRELLLLGLLRREDMHGYQLTEFINRNLASCVDLKKPTAYYLLDKMVEAGWITRSQEQEGSRPPRHVYQITPEGEAAFRRLLRENLSAYHPARFTDDIGLALLDSLPADEARALLSRRREALAAELEAARAAPPHAGSWQLVIDHLRFHLAAELSWLDGILRRLADGGTSGE
ncbi:MAG: PadR family transcriptional regulator [Chloroflexota bacterium]|nr:MAG: PadR family transcriptional regulator [Chloroflexota bacterium]